MRKKFYIKGGCQHYSFHRLTIGKGFEKTIYYIVYDQGIPDFINFGVTGGSILGVKNS